MGGRGWGDAQFHTLGPCARRRFFLSTGRIKAKSRRAALRHRNRAAGAAGLFCDRLACAGPRPEAPPGVGRAIRQPMSSERSRAVGPAPAGRDPADRGRTGMRRGRLRTPARRRARAGRGKGSTARSAGPPDGSVSCSRARDARRQQEDERPYRVHAKVDGPGNTDEERPPSEVPNPGAVGDNSILAETRPYCRSCSHYRRCPEVTRSPGLPQCGAHTSGPAPLPGPETAQSRPR